jgi:hypothetical protein
MMGARFVIDYVSLHARQLVQETGKGLAGVGQLTFNRYAPY